MHKAIGASLPVLVSLPAAEIKLSGRTYKDGLTWNVLLLSLSFYRFLISFYCFCGFIQFVFIFLWPLFFCNNNKCSPVSPHVCSSDLKIAPEPCSHWRYMSRVVASGILTIAIFYLCCGLPSSLRLCYLSWV